MSAQQPKSPNASAAGVDAGRKRAPEAFGILYQKALLAVSVKDWSERAVADRREYLVMIQELHVNILEEFFDEANSCVAVVKSSLLANSLWRLLLIGLTGGLAVLNLLAAYFAAHAGSPAHGETSAGGVASLTLAAALYAAGLAILTNLESFLNFTSRAQAYRESRELFLDAYREFEMLWNVRVRPFGDRPEACVNASEVYRLLVDRDRELRGKLKELTATKKPDSTKPAT